MWNSAGRVPSNEHLLERLTAFSRVIVFDKRGQGLSDRVAEQTLEERMVTFAR